MADMEVDVPATEEQTEVSISKDKGKAIAKEGKKRFEVKKVCFFHVTLHYCQPSLR